MKDKFIEVEIKYYLKNPDKFKSKLAQVAQKAKSDIHQIDTYFTPSHKNFLDYKPVNERLRIRESNKWISVNYKNRYATTKKHNFACDEYESEIQDPEALHKIFKALDFKTVAIVDKLRNTRNYKDVEIAVDNCQWLWRFVEFECKGDFEDIEEATAHLYAVAEELGADLWEQDDKGYPYLLLEKNGHVFSKKFVK